MSISSVQGNEVHQSTAVESGDSIQKETIGAGSPYWMDVEIINSEGSPGTIPLENTQIIIRAPDEFSTGNYWTFSNEWIDFYR